MRKFLRKQKYSITIKIFLFNKQNTDKFCTNIKKPKYTFAFSG